MARPKKVQAPQTVLLGTLAVGDKFTLPDCGKYGTVLGQSVGGTTVKYEGFDEVILHVHKWPNPPEDKVIRKAHKPLQISATATVLPNWPTN